MPYRVNPGRISRQRGSQANALTSVLAQFGMLGVGAAVFALGWLLEIPWLAVPVFLLLGRRRFLRLAARARQDRHNRQPAPRYADGEADEDGLTENRESGTETYACLSWF